MKKCMFDGWEAERDEGRIERQRSYVNRVDSGSLVVPASLPKLQMKPAYVSFSKRTLTGAHKQTYCMCQQRLRESCTGGKKRKYNRGGEGGDLENRFMK